MRIAIRADGSSLMGMGHLVRCGAIAREFMKRGHRVRFFARKEAREWLKEMGFDHVVLTAGTMPSETGEFIRGLMDWGAEAALIDSYELTLECYQRILDQVPTIVIDDYLRLPYSATCLVNTNFYGSSLDYIEGCQMEYLLTGEKYAILREEFLGYQPVTFNDRVSRILVTMGGADLRNYTPVVLRALQDLAGVEIVVVIGPAFQNTPEIREAARKCVGKCRLVVEPKSMAELMSSCDIAVSAAGSTVYELCYMGIPTFLISQADNQNLIFNYFAEKGSMLCLGDYLQVGEEEIRRAVLSLMEDDQLRRQMRSELTSLVDGRGVERVVTFIEITALAHQV